jgi:hypothetical protein
MCQPAFFAPFLLCSLRLASSSASRQPTLKHWLHGFDLAELEAPVIELLCVLEQAEGARLASNLQEAPNADERCLAGALCACAVDAERASSALAERFDEETVRNLSLPFQAIALVLNEHAARLRHAWQRRIADERLGVLDAASC